MEKIMVDLNKSNTIPTRQIINQSGRAYRNIYAACSNDQHVSEEVLKLNLKFQMSIVNLTLFSLNLKDDVNVKLNMPHLKTLKLTDASPRACELIFNSGCKVENLLFQPLRDSEVVIEMLERFLVHSMDSIETLELSPLSSTGALEIAINELQKLNGLKLKFVLRTEPENAMKLNLKMNTSIRSFSAIGLSLENIKACMLATTALNTLSLPDHKFTKHLLEFLATNMKDLKKIFYWTIEDDCVEHYTFLKATRFDINKHLEICWFLATLRRS